MKRDTIYSAPHKKVEPFEFNEDVVQVFPDMIKRSVPGYESVLDMMTVLAGEFAISDSILYDLGCSRGATTRAMLKGLAASSQTRACTVVAVDNAPAMIAQCKQDVVVNHPSISVEFKLADIREVPIERASLVALNYTLQFLDINHRLPLLRGIYEGMVPGGALVLSEKIRLKKPNEHDMLTQLHHAFKRLNGYSDLEISQKRTALDNVLIPESIADHRRRLGDAGFSSSMVWFQSFNFVSILAIK